MKSFHKELWFEIPSRMDFVNITRDVEEAVAASGIQEGLCLVNAMHITASVLLMMMNPVFTGIIRNGWRN